MSKIFDSHVHIKCNQDVLKSCNDVILSNELLKINGCILFIDPFSEEFKCKDAKHYVCVKDSDKEGELQTFCTVCNETKYEGKDPYIFYNKMLLEVSNDNIFPFITLSVSPKTMNDTISYFKENYQNRFYGVKIYTGLSSIILDDVPKLKCNYPLLIHTGYQHNQNPASMLKFLDEYDGYVILAHFARFEKQTLEFIKNRENIYVDTSPAKYLYERYIVNKRNGGLLDRSKLNSPQDFYYRIIDEIGVDKIVFGSDYPFSNREEEIKILKSLKLNLTEHNKICGGNMSKILGRKLV